MNWNFILGFSILIHETDFRSILSTLRCKSSISVSRVVILLSS